MGSLTTESNDYEPEMATLNAQRLSRRSHCPIRFAARAALDATNLQYT